MRKVVFWFLIMWVMAFAACSGDGGSIEEGASLINTSWTRMNMDDAGLSFRVKMDFYSDQYDFLLLQAADAHAPSSATIKVYPDIFRITEDADCTPSRGVYAWVIENDVLILTPVTDACEPRIKAIEGAWERFGNTILNTSWTRLISDGDLSFRGRLDFHEQTFDFVLIDDVSGHDNSSGTLEVVDHDFIMGGDEDCDNLPGRYSWQVVGNVLEIEEVRDECAPRAAVLVGEWELFLPSS
jgi:hypothetical protein